MRVGGHVLPYAYDVLLLFLQIFQRLYSLDSLFLLSLC